MVIMLITTLVFSGKDIKVLIDLDKLLSLASGLS